MTGAAPRHTYLFWALFAVLAGLGLLAPATAGAQSDQGGGVKGTLQYKQADPTQTERLPVAGGEVIVYAAELSPDGRLIVALGDELARGEAAEDGTFFIPLETPGDYAVEINLDSLPDGVTLVDPLRAQLALRLSPNQAKNVLFNLAEEGAETVATRDGGQSKLERAPTRILAGIKFGLIVGMCAIGLSLIYATTGLVNFAHAEMITIGAVLAWWLNSSLGLHLLLAVPIAMVIGGVFGGAMDIGLWRPLRKRGTGLIAMMVVSIGLSILLRYIVLYIFGDRRRAFAQYSVQTDPLFSVLGADMLPKDLAMIVISAAALVGVALVLQLTKLGKAMRAVADNNDLAASTGIDVDRVVTVVWFVAGVLVVLGAVFQGLSEQNHWMMGNQLLLLVFAAVTLGGLGTAYGAMLGSLIVGIVLEMSTLWIPGELRNAAALGVMIILLLVRPQGLLGRRERIG